MDWLEVLAIILVGVMVIAIAVLIVIACAIWSQMTRGSINRHPMSPPVCQKSAYKQAQIKIVRQQENVYDDGLARMSQTSFSTFLTKKPPMSGCVENPIICKTKVSPDSCCVFELRECKKKAFPESGCVIDCRAHEKEKLQVTHVSNHKI